MAASSFGKSSKRASNLILTVSITAFAFVASAEISSASDSLDKLRPRPYTPRPGPVEVPAKKYPILPAPLLATKPATYYFVLAGKVAQRSGTEDAKWNQFVGGPSSLPYGNYFFRVEYPNGQSRVSGKVNVTGPINFSAIFP